MKIVKQLLGRTCRFGGEEHSGWLPANAATPNPTTAEDVLLDLVVVDTGEGGFLLKWSSQDNKHFGDTWHDTIDDARQYAKTNFGIEPSEWRSPPES